MNWLLKIFRKRMYKEEVDWLQLFLAVLFCCIFGTMVSGMAFFSGYVPIVILLDSLLAPPLNAVPNYGQFGLLYLLVCAIGVMGGLSCFLVPLIGRPLWFVIYMFAITAVFALIRGISISGFLNVPDAAFLLVCLVNGLITFAWYPWVESEATKLQKIIVETRRRHGRGGSN